MDNKKRRYYEDEETFIDLPYLLNAEKVLTEREFTSRIRNFDYDNYFSRFLKKKISAFFEKHHKSQWFKDRFIKEKTNNTPIQSPVFVILENVPAICPLAELTSKFLEISGVANVYFSRINVPDYKFRSVFLNLDESSDTASILNDPAVSSYSAKVMDIRSVEIRENYQIPQKLLQNIFNNICSLSSLDPQSTLSHFLAESDAFSSASTESLTAALRLLFYFCPVCCKQYDSQCEMAINCSEHNEKAICQRSLDILGHNFDYQSVRSINQDRDGIKRFVVSTPENTFKCKICTKFFSSVSFICSHILYKHLSHGESTDDENGVIRCLFTEKIDLFTLDILFGTYDRVAPSYANISNSESSEPVVYDMPKVFSGFINF